MTQSPLFPDIVPDPDLSVWNIYNLDNKWIGQATGKQPAQVQAQTLADRLNENVWLWHVGQPSNSAECVRPFGLPW